MLTRTSQSGFSLIELMVALVCTLLVSGAIYGLLSSGQGAFRREPEVADMQQNLRLAMDTISRDVATAGTGTVLAATFAQTFLPNLDSIDLPRPNFPGCTTCSGNTDELSLMTTHSSCEPEAVCSQATGSPGHIWMKAQTTCTALDDTPIILMGDSTWTIRHATNVTQDSGQAPCIAGQHANLTFAAEAAGRLNASGGLCVFNGFGSNPLSCTPTYLLNGDVVTYRINLGGDGVPNLERGSARSLATTGSQFQVLARGIDDLQVEYATANDPTTFVAGAPLVLNNNYSTLITQVRITLSGRTTNQPNLTGMTADTSGRLAIRSSLTSTVAVRTALLAVSRQYASAPSPAPSPFWN